MTEKSEKNHSRTLPRLKIPSWRRGSSDPPVIFEETTQRDGRTCPESSKTGKVSRPKIGHIGVKIDSINLYVHRE